MGNWVPQLLINNPNTSESLPECLKQYLSNAILGPLGSISIIKIYAPEPYSRLVFGISEIEDKGHTSWTNTYVSHIYPCLRTTGLKKTKQNKTKAALFDSTSDLRDANNIKNVCA